jgi:hypothetical protein
VGARGAARVLKPGGHLLAFGGTRTYHRLTCAVEDAGFEVRDCLAWLYGSGFPKSLDVGKAIDKAAGAEREVLGVREAAGYPDGGTAVERNRVGTVGDAIGIEVAAGGVPLTAPATPEAQAWDGWGTALKPAHEPIVVARKPLAGTVAGNVLAHGTGALNVDGCRIGAGRGQQSVNAAGRWPANVVLSHADGCELVGYREVASDGHHPARRGASGYGRHGHHPESSGGGLRGHEGLEERHARGEVVEAWECIEGCPVALLDAQAPAAGAGAPVRGDEPSSVTSGIYGKFAGRLEGRFYGDAGGASRFFYSAKASTAERNAGLDGMPERLKPTWSSGEASPGTFQAEGTSKAARNPHPTVKPVDVMRWLVRLVTPPGGLVLDPFAGSGTTGIAAVLEGFDFVGVERDPDYLPIARARVAWWAPHAGRETRAILKLDADRRRAPKVKRPQWDDQLGFVLP